MEFGLVDIVRRKITEDCREKIEALGYKMVVGVQVIGMLVTEARETERNKLCVSVRIFPEKDSPDPILPEMMEKIKLIIPEESLGVLVFVEYWGYGHV